MSVVFWNFVMINKLIDTKTKDKSKPMYAKTEGLKEPKLSFNFFSKRIKTKAIKNETTIGIIMYKILMIFESS